MPQRSVKDVIENINDLQTLLRNLYRDSEVAKMTLIKISRFTASVEEEQKERTSGVKAREILDFIEQKGSATSLEDLKNFFSCSAQDLTVLHYLINSKKLIYDGVTDKGKQKYNLPISTRVERL